MRSRRSDDEISVRSCRQAAGSLGGDSRPAALGVLRSDPAAVRFNDRAGDGEAQPRPLSGPRRIGAIEAFEYQLFRTGREALTLVGHREADTAITTINFDRDPACRPVAQRVVQEDPEEAHAGIGIAEHDSRAVDDDRHGPIRGVGPPTNLRGQTREVDRAGLPCRPASAAQGTAARRQAAPCAQPRRDVVERVGAVRGRRSDVRAGTPRRPDRRERRSQLVGGVGDEPRWASSASASPACDAARRSSIALTRVRPPTSSVPRRRQRRERSPVGAISRRSWPAREGPQRPPDDHPRHQPHGDHGQERATGTPGTRPAGRRGPSRLARDGHAEPRHALAERGGCASRVSTPPSVGGRDGGAGLERLERHGGRDPER